MLLNYRYEVSQQVKDSDAKKISPNSKTRKYYLVKHFTLFLPEIVGTPNNIILKNYLNWE